MKAITAVAGVCLSLIAGIGLTAPAAAEPASELRVAQKCGGGLSARLGVWEFQQSPQGVTGWNDEATVSYGVTLHPGANAFISAEAKGYDAMGTETWYGLGTSNAVLRRTVPWGNVIANPAIKILNNGPALAPPVDWNC